MHPKLVRGGRHSRTGPWKQISHGRYNAGDVRVVTVVVHQVIIIIIVDKVVAAFVIWRQIWLVGYSRRQCQGLLSLLPPAGAV